MINHVYGDAVNMFGVYRKNTKVDLKGRNISLPEKLQGYIKGTLTVTSQKERERYKQLGHDCSHTLVTENITDVRAGDIITIIYGPITDADRRFVVVDKRNPANIDVWEVLHLNELMSSD